MSQYGMVAQLTEKANELMMLLQSEEVEATDMETGEIMPIEERIDQLQCDVAKTAEVIVAFADEFDAVTASYESKLEQIKNMVAKRKNYTKRLKGYIAHRMDECGIKKIEGELFRITLSGRDSVDDSALNVDDLDERFVRTKIVKEADKTAILAALKNGEEIKGASLKKSKYIIVR